MTDIWTPREGRWLTALTFDSIEREHDAEGFPEARRLRQLSHLKGFAEFKPYPISIEECQRLAEQMTGRESDEPTELRALSSLPAGYVYFGQFVVHDLSFSPQGGLGWNAVDRRTPALDLDSLYGGGLRSDSALYDPRSPGHFALTRSGDGLARQFDVPRVSETGVAVIGDARNDENVMVSQIHVALLRAHNAVLDALARLAPGGPFELYDRARRWLTWHYQWAILNDYLPRILDNSTAELVNERFRSGRGGKLVELPLFTPRRTFICAEFAVAACRFGHALVRPKYRLNATLDLLPILPLGELPEHAHLMLFRPLPPNWFVDWRLFFDLEIGSRPDLMCLRLHGALPESIQPGARPTDRLQRARKFSTKLTWRLGLLPNHSPDQKWNRFLAFRTLSDGAAHRLLSGSDLAELLGFVPTTQLPTPLWEYVLAEANTTLGPLGSAIVGQTLLGLILDDANSVAHAPEHWTPFLGATHGTCSVPDLLLLADEDPAELLKRVQRSGE
jgi:hypothetical protein